MHSVSTQFVYILHVLKAIKIEINRFNIKYGGANEIVTFIGLNDSREREGYI